MVQEGESVSRQTRGASVALLDWCELQDKLVIVMERPEPSKDLIDYVYDSGGYLLEEEGKVILRQLVEGMIDIHSKGVLHRDIKPENILIQMDPEGLQVYILDFGCGNVLTEDPYTSYYAESTRKKSKDKENKRSQFTKDPFRFTRTLLGEAKSGRLIIPKEDVEALLKETNNDTHRNQALDAKPSINSTKILEKELNISEPSWKEVQEVLKKARTGSAPGLSGIPYEMYKKCPIFLRRLWKLIWMISRKGIMPSFWKKAEGCFVPKEENSSTIDHFRTISLLSVESKMLFSVLAKRMTSYMTENGYINTILQKGGIPGFSGCLEHTGVLSQMIHEAKTSKSNLTVVWLDMANAYGSVPHALINTALNHFYIPQHIKRMITSYFGGIQL
ncbi:hypothetical protein AOLI_G00017490 [Acnodon oligacanthus]